MLNIEKLIIETNLAFEDKEVLLTAVQNTLAKKAINTPNHFIIDIAKNFINKNSTLMESTSIIPEVLRQQNFKTVDFLINTMVWGVYFQLAVFVFIGWILPLLFTHYGIFAREELHWKNYYFYGIMIAQLVYYRFLWKKLMP